MHLVSLYGSIIIISLSLLTIRLLSTLTKKKTIPAQYTTIDGLRGYLALSVFICHSSIWYFYIHGQEWINSSANLYILGESSVVIFFMITGFLFSTKLMKAKETPIDWLRLAISRILRLMPLYLFVLFITFIIVMILSDFTAQEPIIRVIKKTIHWIAFTVFENPDINNLKNTWVITAGVTWTFTYEWLFYLSLPFLGLFLFRTNYSLITLLLCGLIFLMIMIKGSVFLICLCPFITGIIASYIIKSQSFNKYAAKKYNVFLIILCLTSVAYFYTTAFELVPLLLLSFVFILIACGNNILGILDLNVSYVLGKIAYSIYLLHGIVLFILFRFIIGFEKSSSLSVLNYWFIIALTTPPLIVICYYSYQWIEYPSIKATSKITYYIRKKLTTGTV